MTKIILLKNIPVDKKHGLLKGKVFDIYEELEPRYKIRASPSVTVLVGALEIALFEKEFERLKELNKS